MSSPIPVHKQHAIGSEPRLRNEEHLIAAATQGDAAAFEVLALRYRRIVMAITRRMSGSAVEAEDLTQQAFLKAFANLSSFAGRSSFSTWLISIARNETLMWLRQARRSREIAMAGLSTEETPDISLDFMDSCPSPETTYMQKEENQLLSAELKRLKPATREALQLCDLEERSCVEAALVLGMTVSGVKSRRLRGRAILRQRIESRLCRRRARLPRIPAFGTGSIHDQEETMNLR